MDTARIRQLFDTGPATDVGQPSKYTYRNGHASWPHDTTPPGYIAPILYGPSGPQKYGVEI